MSTLLSDLHALSHFSHQQSFEMHTIIQSLQLGKLRLGVVESLA